MFDKLLDGREMAISCGRLLGAFTGFITPVAVLSWALHLYYGGKPSEPHLDEHEEMGLYVAVLGVQSVSEVVAAKLGSRLVRDYVQPRMD